MCLGAPGEGRTNFPEIVLSCTEAATSEMEVNHVSHYINPASLHASVLLNTAKEGQTRVCVKTEAEGKTYHTAARLLVTYGRVGAIQADGPRHPLPGSAAACSFGLTVIPIPIPPPPPPTASAIRTRTRSSVGARGKFTRPFRSVPFHSIPSRPPPPPRHIPLPSLE